MSALDGFVSVEPTPENYFRSVVLFGRNVASYKFALAKALLGLASDDQDVVSLADLAEPFARQLCGHLAESPKQSTSQSSKFIDVCLGFNAGEIDAEQLREQTVNLGFNNVIDAFHVVAREEIPVRFFLDERRSRARAIVITEEMRDFATRLGPDALSETEARWRLVETAWELGVPQSIVSFDGESGELIAPGRRRRVTGARDALNGYQKGKCFYCYRPIEISSGALNLAEVDHLFAHALQRVGLLSNLDGVWNLVLACAECNRGSQGKFDATPATKYVARLHSRNEYLIASHHPLRETLILQTGGTEDRRRSFLQSTLDVARVHQVAVWEASPQGDESF